MSLRKMKKEWAEENGLCFLDENSKIVFANDKFCGILGRNRSEVIGKPLSSILGKGVTDKFVKSPARKISTDLYIETENGEKRDILFLGEPVVDRRGRFLGTLGIAKDKRQQALKNRREAQMGIVREEVQETTRELLSELYNGIAAAEERSRLAQEIHSGLAQTLATSLLKIDLCQRMVDTDLEEAKRELKELRDILVKSIGEVRKVLLELNLPRIHRVGFATVLRQYLDEFSRRTKIVCHRDLRLGESFSPRVQVGVYRIIRQVLENVRRRPRAENVFVRLKTDNKGNLELLIEDDGRSFPPKGIARGKKRLVLNQIKEQVRLLGGTLSIQRRAGKGTRIRMKVPIRGEDDSIQS